MKNLILLLLLSAAGTACAKDNFQLHGHISHQLADSVKISYSPPTINYLPVNHTVKLENGDFKVSFHIPDGYTNITIQNGNQQTELIAVPGADLALSIDAANFDSTLHYEGTGKEMANYCAKCVLEKHTTRYIDMKAQKMSDKELPEYEAALKDLVSKENDYLQKNGDGLPAPFKEYLSAAIQYEVYYTMHMYPMKKEMYKTKSNSVKNIPAENYAVIDDIPAAFNDKYVDMPSYRAYINNFFGMRVSAENARNNITMEGNAWEDSVYARSYREMPPLTAEVFAGKHIYYSMQHTAMEEIIKEFADYKTHFPHSKNLPVLEEAIAMKRLIGPGKPEIDFDITTPEGKQMKLSDLKGKAVYIDFWDRGCVPCIAEMKEAKKVRDHFKGKPVAFVYVSLDHNDTIWTKAIKDFGVDGINTRLDKGKESELVQKYEAGSTPAHYLVDKDGKFAQVNVVASPSNPENLIAQIEKLLE